MINSRYDNLASVTAFCNEGAMIMQIDSYLLKAIRITWKKGQSSLFN